MISEFLLESARDLYENLAADIPLAKTREEHIRVTARANAALTLYNQLATADDQ